tara:strand:- start:514 stop:1077 length:564 start_codon:yes stop_codon:yes gene_type:complete
MDLSSMTVEKWLISGVALATVAFLGVALFQPGAFDPEPDWGVSDGCLGGLEHSDVGISEHYHPNLKITVDGQSHPIPANTGIDQVGCREGMRWIHVHNAGENGQFTKLHIETPSKMNVPLGAFFEIWGREGGPSLTDDRKFDINGNGVSDWDEFEITMNVNGDSDGNFEEYVMEDLDNIELTFTSKQ